MRLPYLFLLALPVFMLSSLQAQDTESAVATPKDTDESASRLIEYHYRALGGRANMANIHTVKAEGFYKENTVGLTLDCSWKRLIGFHQRVKQRHLGVNYVERWGYGYTTSEWWVHKLEPERKPVATLAKADRDSFQFIASFISPLYQHSGFIRHYEYMGEVNSNGAMTYLLKASAPDNGVCYFYLDKQNLLLRRIGYTGQFGNDRVDADIYITRYERHAGVLFPVKFEYRVNGKTFRTVEFKNFKINEYVPDSLIHVPYEEEVWLKGGATK